MKNIHCSIWEEKKKGKTQQNKEICKRKAIEMYK